MSIVVIGTTFVDIKGYPDGKFIPDGRNKGYIKYTNGGVARNITEDIANMELRPVFVSSVDDTPQGQAVIDQLNRHKVHTQYIRKAENGMGTWLAVFNDEGDVAAQISKRPDMSTIRAIMDEDGDEIFKNADSILLEIDIDKEIVHKAFHYAEKYSIPVYADVSVMSVALDRRDYIAKTDVFVCNQQEAGMLFYEDLEGRKPEEMLNIVKSKVMNTDISCLIITLGENGSVYADKEGRAGYCPAKKVTVNDTTGAGDAFFAGAAAALTYGADLDKACEIGTTLAASTVTSFENVCPRFNPRELGLDIDLGE